MAEYPPSARARRVMTPPKIEADQASGVCRAQPACAVCHELRLVQQLAIRAQHIHVSAIPRRLDLQDPELQASAEPRPGRAR